MNINPIATSPWKRNLVVSVFGSFTTILSMTILIPFLPSYVASMGVTSLSCVTWWSGVAFGATFLSAALTAPLWGKVSDRFGRKLMLVRASLGMAVSMSLMGLATHVWQLVALRLLVGLMGGYASGSNIMVATQTPKERVGWALGILSVGIMAGNLMGPLIGGILPSVISIREIFFLAGGLLFMTFLATSLLMKEDRDAMEERRNNAASTSAEGSLWSRIVSRPPVIAMLVTGCLLMLANMSIEPIIAVYVGQLHHFVSTNVSAGVVMAAAALGSILSAPWLGRQADKIGAWKMIIVCLTCAAVLLVPQAFASSSWQLIILRFFMGLALGGLLPSIANVIRSHVPSSIAGAVLGVSVSAQYIGQVVGPLLGGYIGGHIGMRFVFMVTCLLLIVGILINVFIYRRSEGVRP